MKTINDIPPYLNLSLEDMEGEIWKDVVGFEGLYMVSNMGRIKALASVRKFGKTVRKHRLRIMKQFPNWQGYLGCKISDLDGNKVSVAVHKCVANAFIPKTKDSQCVNHRDENKQNNAVNNLEWCTFSYNLTYGSREKCRYIPVQKLSLDGELIAEYESVKDAAKANNVHRRGISNCLHGWAKTCGGFIWKLKLQSI